MPLHRSIPPLPAWPAGAGVNGSADRQYSTIVAPRTLGSKYPLTAAHT